MTPFPTANALRLTAADINAFLGSAFAGSDDDPQSGVIELEPGRARVVRRASQVSLRPGGVISGPTMMSLADMAVYALVLGHIGIVPMAVTTSLTIHFLRPAKPGDLFAEALLLRLGRRIATAEVRLWSEAPDRIAAHATVAYAIPEGVT
jgi:uncharacterized protein (TIGR00369 family)